MSVTFIGAGPGDPELITLKGYRYLQQCSLCLYAGSLVPPSLLEALPQDAPAIDTAPLVLDEIIQIIENHHGDGRAIARLHSGDPSIYGAIAEQMHALDEKNIPYDIIPGVPSFAAAAASLKKELTMPEITQSVILTRFEGKASPMPKGESLAHFAQSRATLVIHLSIRSIAAIVRELIPFYGETAPVAIVHHASREDETIIETTLRDAPAMVRKHKITRTALIIVSPVLGQTSDKKSALYDPAHRHIFRT